MSSNALTFVWPGDLHLEFPDRDNYKTALWMTEEVNALIQPDFVQFAGDNVQHAREGEFALFKEVYGKLKAPFHALVGDHDAHHDAGALAHQARLGATYHAFTLRGYRFICLNTMQFRPLGMSKEQVIWFHCEVDSALVRGERVVVFQHHYPFQIWEDFAGQPGMEGWRRIVQTRPITALFAGHTHYAQIANDGRNVYIATRSIGDAEGGPAGYAVVFLDGDDLALTHRSVEDKGPVVLITHPRRLILATRAAHIVTTPDECRARVWPAAEINSVKARVDDGPWEEMRRADGSAWSHPLPSGTLAKGEHTLEVRATSADGSEGADRLTFLLDRSGRFNPYPAVEPVVRETKFC
ncbi:MAG: metallophosphoesterase [Verrucomicrobiota bacterium]|nr:metallophosphoesterase [Verrucomicrobiota bacterium]